MIGVGGLVLVGSFQASSAAILVEQIGNCVALLAIAQEGSRGEDCGGEEDCCTEGNGGCTLPLAGARGGPKGGGKEDGHWRFDYQDPAPWVLQETQFGQQIPDWERDGEQEKENDDGDQGERNTP